MKTNTIILVSILLIIQAVQCNAQVARPDYQNIILNEINTSRKKLGVFPIEKISRYQQEADAAVSEMFLDWLWLDSLVDEDYERMHMVIDHLRERTSGSRLYVSVLLYGWDEDNFMDDIRDVFGDPESSAINSEIGFAAVSVLEDQDTGELYGVVLTYRAINPCIPRPELSDIVIKEVNAARSKSGIHPVGEIKRYREQSDSAVEILYREFSVIDTLCDDDYVLVHDILNRVVKDKSGGKQLSQTILYSSDRDDFVPMLRLNLLSGDSMNMNPKGRFIATSILEDSVTGELYVAIMLYE